MVSDGIVLFAKKSGYTSFNSLYVIKKALATKKVGHTGTLDSFADGLLVVCSGFCTHLVPYITEFDKEYEAVIHFGEETDTLDPTGKVVKTSSLPNLSNLKSAVKKWTGTVEQVPPSYSAIHINGKRLSDLSREGKNVQIPSRKITVFASEIIECRTSDGRKCDSDDDEVLYAHIHFAVSKGTYIRSLARDIALDAFSCAHLASLRRTRVGKFKLEDACGFSFLPDFTIENAIENETKIKMFNCEKSRASESPGTNENHSASEKSSANFAVNLSEKFDENTEELLKKQIKNSLCGVTENLALDCGFCIADLDESYLKDFQNGKKLKKSMFVFSDGNEPPRHTTQQSHTTQQPYPTQQSHTNGKTEYTAVFCKKVFCGLIYTQNLNYCFVVSDRK